MRRMTRLLGALRWLSDEGYVRLAYRLERGERLDLRAPGDFWAKLQRLKLAMGGRRGAQRTDRILAQCVDKYAARRVAARALGADCLMALLGVWRDPRQIDWTRLTQKCVLKCTHGSHAGVVYDPLRATPRDRRAAAQRLRQWMGCNWYWHGREPPYRHVVPRIIAEAWEPDAAQDDYKVMCMGGEPLVIQHHRHRPGQGKMLHTIDLYDRFGVRLDGVRRAGYPATNRRCLDGVLAARLSQAARKVAGQVRDAYGQVWPYVRVDLYQVGGKIKFGEITFFDSAGFGRYDPPAFEQWLGRMIPVDADACPRCLGKMRPGSVEHDGLGMVLERRTTCARCGYVRVDRMGVDS